MAAAEVPQIQQWADVNRERAVQTLRLLNDHLAGSRYFAGDRFSIADITALVTVDFSQAGPHHCPGRPDRAEALAPGGFRPPERSSMRLQRALPVLALTLLPAMPALGEMLNGAQIRDLFTGNTITAPM